MKATDFNLAEELRFNTDTGVTTFKDARMVIFDSNAIGLLRQNIIELIGFEKAREFFLRFGYQQGYSDFLQLKVAFDFDSDLDLLSCGPVIHTWEGIVHAAPSKLDYDRESGDFYFSGVWSNSYEAQQHLSYYDCADEPVCWSLMGYASGYATAFFGSPLMAIEPKCVGKGDDRCEWLIQPPDKWGSEADKYRQVYASFWSTAFGASHGAKC